MYDGLFHFVDQQLYDFVLPHLVVFGANFCRNGEARGDGDAYEVHLCQIGSLATQQVAHVGPAFCLAVTKGINSFFVHNLIRFYNIIVVCFVRKANYISHIIKLFFLKTCHGF